MESSMMPINFNSLEIYRHAETGGIMVAADSPVGTIPLLFFANMKVFREFVNRVTEGLKEIEQEEKWKLDCLERLWHN